mmetsp:Transcript_60729/g.144624  ORF Transcript_60729/g.144624 Transcript_60729/m.144624 type:complete len:214 (-) Transcript_60729:2799-3440(-)
MEVSCPPCSFPLLALHHSPRSLQRLRLGLRQQLQDPRDILQATFRLLGHRFALLNTRLQFLCLALDRIDFLQHSLHGLHSRARALFGACLLIGLQSHHVGPEGSRCRLRFRQQICHSSGLLSHEGQEESLLGVPFHHTDKPPQHECCRRHPCLLRRHANSVELHGVDENLTLGLAYVGRHILEGCNRSLGKLTRTGGRCCTAFGHALGVQDAR